jgi:hypothetical protein
MLYKKISLSNNTEISIQIQAPIFFENSERIVFGFPFNYDLISQNSHLKNLTENLKGYWLMILIKEDGIEIITDILGGVRIYYTKNDTQIIISDDYLYLEKEFKDKKINFLEIEYWKKHGFTTGQGTFLEGIKKVSPASILKISSGGVTESTYFMDKKRIPDAIKHAECIHEDLKDTFENIKKLNKKVVLLFSGGKDSCLILQYLLKGNIDFIPVFFKTKPLHTTTAEDLNRAKNVAAKLNINLTEIEVELSNISVKEKCEILKEQILDKHYSLLHYSGMKKIKDIYGEDVIVINGQSSDSILSFGPSENSTMSYFRRNIMYFPKSLTSIIGLLLLCIKTRNRFRLPKSKDERLVSLFDEFKYTRVIEVSKSNEYMTYINKYLITKTKELNSYFSKEMYSKILSFCQGSDNQVVVNSAFFNKLNLVMPFATPSIIYNTIVYKNEKIEIKNPKYSIDIILRDFFQFNYSDLIMHSNSTKEVKGVENKSVEEMEFLFEDFISNRYNQ